MGLLHQCLLRLTVWHITRPLSQGNGCAEEAKAGLPWHVDADGWHYRPAFCPAARGNELALAFGAEYQLICLIHCAHHPLPAPGETGSRTNPAAHTFHQPHHRRLE